MYLLVRKIELPILLAHPVAHPVGSIHTTQMPVYIRKHCLSQSVLCGLIECPPTCFSGYFIHSQNVRKVVVLRCLPNGDTVQYMHTLSSPDSVRVFSKPTGETGDWKTAGYTKLSGYPWKGQLTS